MRVRVRCVAVVVLVAVLAGGLVLQVGSDGWPDRWLAKVGLKAPKVWKAGRFNPPPPSAGVPMAAGSGRGLSVDQWLEEQSARVGALVGAEPAERVLSPSTRLVRVGPGEYSWEDAGEARWRADGQGGWEPIRLEPELLADGPRAVSYGGAMVPTSFGRNGGPAVMFDVDGHEVRLSAPGLALGEPEVRETVVTYREVAPGVDLRYLVEGDGVKELLVLKDKSAPRSFRFHLADPDGVLGEPVRQEDGRLEWSGSEGSDKQVVIPPAYAYASDGEGRVDPARAQPSPGNASLGQERVAGGWDLVLSVDEEWASGQIGPVTLDPSIYYYYGFGRSGAGTMGKGAAMTATVWKDQGSNRCRPFYACPPLLDNYPVTVAGTNTAAQQYRSVFRWNYGMDYATYRVNNQPYPAAGLNVPMRARITPGTTLFLSQVSCLGNAQQPPPGAPCSPYPDYVVAQNLSAPVTPASNWNTVGASMTGPLSYDQVISPAVADRRNWFYYQGAFTSIDVRPIVQQWVDNPAAAHGLALRSLNEAATPRGEWYFSRFNRPSGCLNYDGATVNQPGYAGYYSCEVTHPFLHVNFAEDAPYWSAGAAKPTATVNGSTVAVRGTQTDKGTYGIWYASALVNADTGIVSQWGPTRIPGSPSEAVSWDFANVPSGRYYVLESAANHATTPQGTPAYGLTQTEVFSVAGPAGSGGGGSAGREAWWSFDDHAVGPQATAGVNVGNGNLVLQQADGAVVQGHGRQSLGLERTYNSTAPAAVGLPGIGQGWSFVTSSAGDLGAFGAAGLALGCVLQPEGPGVSLVDRDGTSHCFTPKATSLSVQLGDRSNGQFTLQPGPLVQSLLSDPARAGAVTGSLVDYLTQSVGSMASLASVNLRVCLDTSYESPRGVHTSLWRFVGIGISQPCGTYTDVSGPLGGSPVVLGYATVSPDRVRQVYSAFGKLISSVDPAGNELRYEHGLVGTGLLTNLPVDINGVVNQAIFATPFSQLQRIYDPKQCPGPLTLGCRQLTFSYGVPFLGPLTVTDPAGRTTSYTTDPLSQTLSEVVTRSASGAELEKWSYSYQGVGLPAASCGGTFAQMCSVTAPNGSTTRFTYENGKVRTLAERFNGAEADGPTQSALTTTYAYGAGQTDVVADGRTRRYAGIDADLRVSDIYVAPDTPNAGQALSRAHLEWDRPGVTCQKPGDGLNHNLCSSTRFAGSVNLAGAPDGYVQPADQTTSRLYNPEGYVLTESAHLEGTTRLTTSSRYLVSSFGPGPAAAVTTQTDDFDGVATARPTDALFRVVDRTGSRSPKGEVTSYDVDADPAVPMGKLGAACGAVTRSGAPQAGGGNSGLVCHARAPEAQVTSRAYDSYGQTATETDPSGATTAYSYFGDADRDLTGQTSAGGWLRRVTDPTGAFVAFGYDRAGNVVRSWDRNATSVVNPQTGQPYPADAFPGTASAPTTARYVEQQYADKPTAAEAFTEPWRYLRTSRTAKGEVTRVTVDAHGNPTVTQTPLGLRTTRTFSVRDEKLTEALPATPTAESKWRYDGGGRSVAVIDPEGHATVTAYDLAGRPDQLRTSRDAWAARSPEEEAKCRQSTAADDPIPAGRVLCTASSTYLGTGQTIVATDQAGATTWTTYDPAGRTTDVWVPRAAGQWNRSSTLYDANSQPVVACDPTHYVDQGGLCLEGSHYATRTSYDALGRPIFVRRDRQQAASNGARTSTFDTLTTAYAYDTANRAVTVTDPNGNPTTTRYDVLGRKIEQVTPRGPGQTISTRWSYDRAGNTAAASTGSDNIPTNASFEDDLTGWAAGGSWAPGLSTEASHGAKRVTSTRSETSGWNVLSQNFVPRSGEKLSLRAVFGQNASARQSHIKVDFWSSPGREPGTNLPAVFFVVTDGAVSWPTAIVRDGAQAATVPAGAVSAQLSLMSAYSADGSPAETTYDAIGLVYGDKAPDFADRNETITSYAYDENNQLVDSVEAASTETAARDALVATSNPPRNLRNRRYYDADGRLVATLDPRGFTANATTPDQRYQVRTDLDGNGRPTARWTPLWDNAAASPLDASGGPERTECPEPTSGRQPTAVTGVAAWPAGVGVCRATAVWSVAGRLERVTNPVGGAYQYQQFTYTDDGLIRTADGPDPKNGSGWRVITDRRAYDATGRAVRSWDAAGYQRETTWTADGLQATVTGREPGGPVQHQQTTTYDANGRPATSATVIDDTRVDTTTTAYYADGLLAEQVNPAPQSTTYRWAYDGASNPTSVWSPSAISTTDANNTANLPVRHFYTRDNLLAQTVEPVASDGSQRRATVYAYDGAGRKTSQAPQLISGVGPVATPSSAPAQTFTYSGNGLALAERGRGGNGLTSKAYDPLGQLLGANDASGTAVSVSRFLNGAERRVATTKGGDSFTTGFAWHADGVRDRLVAGNADLSSIVSTQATSWNDARLPATNTTTGWGGTSAWSWTYDQASRPDTQKDADNRLTKWVWRPDGQLDSQRLVNDSNGNGTVDVSDPSVDSWTVSRDKVGRPRSVDRNRAGAGSQTETFTYDGDGRVSTVNGDGVVWDPDGNRVLFRGQLADYQADGSIKGPGVTYDPAGNLKTADCRTNTYDGLDRLTGATGCSKPAVSTTFDGLDRQASTTTGGQLRTLRYSGTAGTVLAEEDASPAKTARYLLGPDGAALGVSDNTNQRQTLSTDPQGSTVLTLTGAGAQCAARFDPWGDPQQPAGPDNPCQTGVTVNNRWYLQGRRDQTTGTYQMGSRTYDPSKAAWLSADNYRAAAPTANLSINVDPLTQNRYAYVNGDPISLQDPDGHGPGCKSLPLGKGVCRKGVDKAKAYAEAAKDVAVEAYHEVKDAAVDAYHEGKDFVEERYERAADVAKPVAKKVVDKAKPAAKAAVAVGKFAWRNRKRIQAGATVLGCGAATVASVGTLAAVCAPVAARSLADAFGSSDDDSKPGPAASPTGPAVTGPEMNDQRKEAGEAPSTKQEEKILRDVSACPSWLHNQTFRFLGYGDFVRAEYYADFSDDPRSLSKAQDNLVSGLFGASVTTSVGNASVKRIAARSAKLGGQAAKYVPYVSAIATAGDGLCMVTRSYRDAT